MKIARKYWTTRYNKEFSYRSSAHISFSWSYNQYVYKAYLRTFQKMLRRIDFDLKGKHVIDIGSGTGFYVNYFKRSGVASLIGTDITELSVIKLTKKFREFNFFQHDIAEQFPVWVKKRSFDLISIFDVLYYLVDDKSFERAIKNIASLCSENTLVVITDKFKLDIPQKGIKYYKHRSYEQYKDVLKMNRMKIIDRRPVNFLLKKPIPLSAFYSFFKWELSKINFDLEGAIGHLLYQIDPLFMNLKRSDIQMVFVKKL